MEFSELIDLLKVTLSAPLSPHELDDVLGHFKAMRGEIPISGKIKESGVLLFFYPVNNIPHLLLIKRSTYKGAHSGQISFPGGKKEKADANIQETALREAKEEVAIHAPRVLGQLSDVYVPVSQFNITPVVAFADIRPPFIPEEREVDSILEMPVSLLFEDTLFEFGSIEISQQVKIKTYYFQIEQHIVWGATAMIIAELRSYLLRNFN